MKDNNKPPLVTLTKTALLRVIALLSTDKSPDNKKLRAYIVGGGCSGFQYGFKLDDVVESDDVVIDNFWENKKVTLVIDSLSLQYLMGAEIDYEVSLQGSRFLVQNPNAQATCSCGSSFALKEEG